MCRFSSKSLKSSLTYLVLRQNFQEISYFALQTLVDELQISAMKCSTAFCESVDLGFVFERLCKIMKEHKNPKVLSEGLLWMVSVVDDFGVSLLKLKIFERMLDCNLVQLPPSMLQSIFEVFYASLLDQTSKGFLTHALDVEYEEKPMEGTVAPKRIVKTSLSPLTSAIMLDRLPREDISSKIALNLRKGFDSHDWKVLLESIEAVSNILKEAN